MSGKQVLSSNADVKAIFFQLHTIVSFIHVEVWSLAKYIAITINQQNTRQCIKRTMVHPTPTHLRRTKNENSRKNTSKA